MEAMFEEAQEVAAMLIKSMGFQEALIYVTTHPVESLEQELVQTAVRTAIIQQMGEELLN